MRYILFIIAMIGGLLSFNLYAADCPAGIKLPQGEFTSFYTNLGPSGVPIYFFNIDGCEYYSPDGGIFSVIKDSFTSYGDIVSTGKPARENKPESGSSSDNLPVTVNEPVLNCSVMKNYLTIDSSLFSDSGGIYNGCLYENKKSTIDIEGNPQTLQTSVFNHKSVDFSQFQEKELSLYSYFLAYSDYNSQFSHYLDDSISSGTLLYKRIFTFMQSHKDDLESHPNDFKILQSYYALLVSYVQGFVSLRNQYNDSDFKPGVAYIYDESYGTNYYLATSDHRIFHCFKGYTHSCDGGYFPDNAVKLYARKKELANIEYYDIFPNIPHVDISDFHYIYLPHDKYSSYAYVVSNVPPVFNESHFLGLVNFINKFFSSYPHNSYIHAAAFLDPSTPLDAKDSFMDFSLFPNRPDDLKPSIEPDEPSVDPVPPVNPDDSFPPSDGGSGGGGGGGGGGIVTPPVIPEYPPVEPVFPVNPGGSDKPASPSGGDSDDGSGSGGGAETFPVIPDNPSVKPVPSDKPAPPSGDDSGDGSGSGGGTVTPPVNPDDSDKPVTPSDGGSGDGSGGGHGSDGTGQGGGDTDGDGDALLEEVKRFHADANQDHKETMDALDFPSSTAGNIKKGLSSDINALIDSTEKELTDSYNDALVQLKNVFGDIDSYVPDIKLSFELPVQFTAGIMGRCVPLVFDFNISLVGLPPYHLHAEGIQACKLYDLYVRSIVEYMLYFMTALACRRLFTRAAEFITSQS